MDDKLTSKEKEQELAKLWKEASEDVQARMSMFGVLALFITISAMLLPVSGPFAIALLGAVGGAILLKIGIEVAADIYDNIKDGKPQAEPVTHSPDETNGEDGRHNPNVPPQNNSNPNSTNRPGDGQLALQQQQANPPQPPPRPLATPSGEPHPATGLTPEESKALSNAANDATRARNRLKAVGISPGTLANIDLNNPNVQQNIADGVLASGVLGHGAHKGSSSFNGKSRRGATGFGNTEKVKAYKEAVFARYGIDLPASTGHPGKREGDKHTTVAVTFPSGPK